MTDRASDIMNKSRLFPKVEQSPDITLLFLRGVA